MTRQFNKTLNQTKQASAAQFLVYQAPSAPNGGNWHARTPLALNPRKSQRKMQM
jgi:hypothetical protein